MPRGLISGTSAFGLSRRYVTFTGCQPVNMPFGFLSNISPLRLLKYQIHTNIII